VGRGRHRPAIRRRRVRAFSRRRGARRDRPAVGTRWRRRSRPPARRARSA
jgi:hypothetical protein